MKYVSRKHEEDKIIVFERGIKGLIWVFNFNTTKSFTDYQIGCSQHGKLVAFEGIDNSDASMNYVNFA